MRRTTRLTRLASRIDTAAQDTVRNRDVKPSSAVCPNLQRTLRWALTLYQGIRCILL